MPDTFDTPRVYISGTTIDDARLQAWGRGPDGWHALVIWRDRVDITGAVWLPAHRIVPPMGHPSGLPIQRILLPEDHEAWPRPPDFHDWWAGVSDADYPPLPTGVARRPTPDTQRRRYT